MTVGLTQEAQRRCLRPAQFALRATTENTENTEKEESGPASHANDVGPFRVSTK